MQYLRHMHIYLCRSSQRFSRMVTLYVTLYSNGPSYFKQWISANFRKLRLNQGDVEFLSGESRALGEVMSKQSLLKHNTQRKK